MKCKYNTVIGIDPDSEKSGIAVLDVPSKQFTGVQTLKFAELIDLLVSFSGKSDCMVYIEAGWLNHGNWHTSRADNAFVAAKKGLGVGRNQQTGMLIAEMCDAYQVPHTEIKPLKKCWSGTDKKIKHDELVQIVGNIKHTNQEGRDAVLIAWSQSGLPIKVAKQ